MQAIFRGNPFIDIPLAARTGAKEQMNKWGRFYFPREKNRTVPICSFIVFSIGPRIRPCGSLLYGMEPSYRMNLKRTPVNESLHRMRKKPRPGELFVMRETPCKK